MKLYHGYNKDYSNYGVNPEQNHIWTTTDLSYAQTYANDFENGGIVEFDIDESKMNLADEYDIMKIIGEDDWDNFGGIIDADNDMCDMIKQNGYNIAYMENGDYDIFLILDKSLIKSSKELDNDSSYDDEINECLRIAGISEPLEEMAYPDNFDLRFFSNIRTFKDRIAYCKTRLQKLGEGSSRIAYKVDDKKALKIAKNRRGIAQNEHECDWGRNNYGIFAEIYDADTDNYTWVEMEIAQKAKKEDFEEIIGYEFGEIADVIKVLYNEYVGKKKYYGFNTSLEWAKEIIENEIYTEHNEFLCMLSRYMADYQPDTIGNFTVIQNWGKVIRNGQEMLVIIDDGVNNDIMNAYYRR